MARSKSPSPYYRADNSGGYGNPPVKGQFKKGNRGGGRPRGAKSFDAAMRKMMQEPITMTRADGQEQTLTPVEAIAYMVRKAMLSPSPKALELAIKMMEKYAPPPSEDPQPGDDWVRHLNMDEKRLWRVLIARCDSGGNAL